MTLDARARATASRLVAKYGKAITYTTNSDGAYDPTTSIAAQVQSVYPLKALVQDFGNAKKGAASFDGDQTVRTYEKLIQIAAADITFVPLPKDKISFDTFNLSAVRVVTIYGGELAAMYEIHCSE